MEQRGDATHDCGHPKTLHPFAEKGTSSCFFMRSWSTLNNLEAITSPLLYKSCRERTSQPKAETQNCGGGGLTKWVGR